MVGAYQKGEASSASPEVKRLAHSMTHQQVHDFAATKGLEHRAFGGSMSHGDPLGGLAKPKPVHIGAAPKAPAMPHDKMVTPSQGTPWWSRQEARTLGKGFAEGGRTGMADGGGMEPMSEASPWWERQEARIPDIPFTQGGLIGGSGAGRTDRLPLSVASESHVIPSDVVSALGQGTSAQGGRMLHAILGGGTGPFGTPLPHEIRGHGPPHPPAISPRIAQEGQAEGGATKPTSILAASGEFVATPQQVWNLGARAIRAGRGKKGETPMDAGHRLLDEMIHNVRQWQIRWLKTAPPPKR